MTDSQPRVAGGRALFWRMAADQPERTIQDEVDLLVAGGFDVATPKAADGDQLEGDFDDQAPGDELALTTLGRLRGLRDGLARRGVRLVPYVVPRGYDAEAEAGLHAAIARATGGVVVDFEPYYAGFWGRDQRGGVIPAVAGHEMTRAVDYFAALRAGAPDALIAFSCDPRQVAHRDYDPAPLLAHCDEVWPQTYWTLFGQSWQGALSVGLNLPVGGRPICPVLPGDAAPLDLLAALKYLHERGVSSYGVHSRVLLTDPRLLALKEGAGEATPANPGLNSPAWYEANIYGPIVQAGARWQAAGGAGDAAAGIAVINLALAVKNARGAPAA